MSVRPFELIRQLSRETEQAKLKIDAVRAKSIQRTERLRRLTERQTDAFVELAKHYLPKLSHCSLPDAWLEVRDQIGELLLQKDDRRRSLSAQLQEICSQRELLEQERERVRQDLDHARLVLSCKTGNYKKMMREDPAIIERLHRIDVVDEEIERGLAALEHVESDAMEKLPAYEQCNLFQYLLGRHFGTTNYCESGLERRWDRWVAKLIDFENAKAGFDHLTQAPDRLRDLIAEKQKLYRRLLEELDAARDKATERFGVADQTSTWQSLSKRVGMLDESIEQSRWTESCLADDLYEIENINGEFYDQAINVYFKFLGDLDPEILKVYAACTESPVDDEICARVRNVQNDIANQRLESKHRTEQLEANDIGAVLSASGINHFACQPNPRGRTDPAHDERPDEVHVMVAVGQRGNAYETLVKLRQSIENPWECGVCRANVERGYAVCHHCGNHRVE